MENKDQNGVLLSSESSDANLHPSGLHAPPIDTSALSLEPEAPEPFTSQERPRGLVSRVLRFVRRLDVLLFLLLLIAGGVIFFTLFNRESNQKTGSSAVAANRFDPVRIPLSDLLTGKDLSLSGAANVVINGTMQLNNSLLLAPSIQPVGARAGQIYYDQTTNQLAYFNGEVFVYLTQANPGGIQSIGGATGQLTLGNGLTVGGGQLANTGVLSVQGTNGNVTFTAGPGLTINGTTFSNDGVISLTSASPNITVENDGQGNITLDMAALPGSGTVTSAGGNTGKIPVFTAAQNIEDSIISQSGLNVSIAGNLNVTSALTIGTALSVDNGGTGNASLTNNGVLVGQGTSAISSVAAGGAGLCLLSTAGAPTWAVCPGAGGGGVTTLNGLAGALNIANASGVGTTITIDDASTSSKGIASFNGTNFSVTGGAVNTTQDINTGAAPTFSGVNTNNITPSGTLTVGAVGQTLILQGNASTQLTANNGANNTTISFQSPTGNATYRFLTASGTFDVCTTTGNCAGVGGGVTTSGGTTNRLSKFTGAQSVGDSTISDDGTNVLTSIDLVVQGGDLTVGVPTSQSGTVNLAHSGSAFLGSIVQGAISANRTYTLPDANGTFCLSTGNCPASGVTSLNGLIGALNIANASGVGTTITIDDASTSAKGIASFNGTNFSVTGGAVNTIQNINTTASPTFTAINTNTLNPSAALTIGATGQTTLLRGSITTITSNGAGNDIILTSADSIELQGTTNVTGNADVSGTFTSGTGNAFQVAANGDISTAGVAIISGASVTVGGGSQAGSFILNDGSSNTGTLSVAPLGQDTVYTLPDPGVGSVSICLTSGNCAGTGGGVTTPGGSANRLAKFTGAQAIGDSTISDNGTNVTTTVDLIIQGGDMTVGVASSQTGTISLAHSSSAFLGSILQGALTGNRTYTLPDADGTICLTSGNCSGSGSPNTLQAAYEAGNTIATTNSRDIAFTLANTAADSNFTIDIATDSTGTVAIRRTNGAGTNDPSQLLLLDNLDTDRLQPTGLRIQSVAGGMTTAIDASDPEIITALSTGDNDIGGTNYSIAGATGNIITSGDIAANGGDITSSGALNITPGGTLTIGATGEQLVLQGNASTQITATGGGFTTTLGFTGSPAGAVTYNLDRSAAAGAYTICTTIGNCAGVGGSGTTGAIAKFTGAQTIGDSLLSESGSVVTVNGNLNLISGNQYRVNGTQISSADLSNDANLAKLNASQTFTGTTNVFQNGSNSTNAFSVQTAAAARVLTVDTTNTQVILGHSSAANGALVFANSTNANLTTLSAGTPTGNRTIGLPDASGTICLQNSLACGFLTGSATDYIQNQNSVSQTANWRITGTGRADTALQAPILDTASAGALAIGTTNATSINLQQDTTVASGKTVTIQGLTAINLASNSTSAFNIKNAGSNNVFTVDSTNGRVGIGLGSNTVPTLSNQGIELKGAIRLSGADGTFSDVYTTPLGGTVNTMINIANYDPGAAAQLIALGLPSGANATSRAISIFDARSGAHQPTLAVLSPDQNQIAGFSWDGSNSTFATKTSSNNMVLQANALNILTLQNVSSAARLGVGNGTPGYALDVTGDANISSGSAYKINGTDICTAGGCVPITTCAPTGNYICQGGNTPVSSTAIGTTNAQPLNFFTNGATRASISSTGIFQVLGNGTGSARIGGDCSSNYTAINLGGSTPFDCTSYNFLSGPTDTSLYINRPSGGSIFVREGNSSTNQLSIAAGGALTAQNTTDTTAGFRVLNAGSVPQFQIDTSTSRVYIGNPVADTTGALLVLDTKTSAGDPTGVDGGMYYNSNIGKMRCYENGEWRDCTSSARTGFRYIADLFTTGGDSIVGISSGGTGSSNNNIASIAGHQGIIRLSTGTTTGGWGNVGSNDAGQAYSFGSEQWQYETVLRPTTLSNGTDTFVIRGGFGDSFLTDGANGCFFRYTHNANSANWQGMCMKASAATTCNTAVAVAAGTWYRLTISINAAASSVTFSINGAVGCTISTGIPSGTGQEMSWNTAIAKAGGTTARTMDVDYVELSNQYPTSR